MGGPEQVTGFVVDHPWQPDHRVRQVATVNFAAHVSDQVDQRGGGHGVGRRGQRSADQDVAVGVDQGGPHLGPTDVRREDGVRSHRRGCYAVTSPGP